MSTKVQFKQSDVRRGATLLAKYEKGVRLDRGQEVTRPLYVQWISFRNQFVHEHSLEEETKLYLAQNPAIAKEIRV